MNTITIILSRRADTARRSVATLVVGRGCCLPSKRTRSGAQRDMSLWFRHISENPPWKQKAGYSRIFTSHWQFTLQWSPYHREDFASLFSKLETREFTNSSTLHGEKKIHPISSHSSSENKTKNNYNRVPVPSSTESLSEPSIHNISYLPKSLHPYAQLARLDKPIGTFLLLHPCLWSTALATTPLGSPPDVTLCALFAAGSFFMRGAGCTINDIWDAEYDKNVERTKDRPLASGRLNYRQATMFLGLQVTGGLGVLLSLPHLEECFVWGVASLPLVTLYPLMKRYSNYPQFVLGMTFNWGAIMGWVAVRGSVDWSVVGPLYASGVAWTLVYDTLYAHQDKIDDAKLGLKSTALTFGESGTKPILTALSAATWVGWMTAGCNCGFGDPLEFPLYYTGCSIAAAHLLWQVQTADLNDANSLAYRFRSNNTVGWIVLGSCVGAYRIKGSPDEGKPFVPFEKGNVGNVQDPTTASRTRVNQGYDSFTALGESVGKNRLFSCPQMVGPLNQKFFCRGKQYGYCDRRSGVCFCNDGYMGISCESCAPTHFEMGELCYPKKLCPNDCSNAGVCNYQSGRCECDEHREGEDCSNSICSRFHEFCTICNDDGCIECEEGFSLHETADFGFQCEPCHRFDPRCITCNTIACTSCIDLLLLSIHRSGRRPQDPPLPIDELTRELSITVPFGSKQEDAFYDAESYFLVDSSLVPLNESAVECHQGLNSDNSTSCVPYNMTSHIMCGNYGTITFESPEYAVREDERHVRLTLQRSGGGVGPVSVSYSVYPITADREDVTSTAFYTSNKTVVFRHGQIRASFVVTINDDRVMEQNETFSVHLSNPSPLGRVRLGTQQRTIVTIIDDDENQTCSKTSYITSILQSNRITSHGDENGLGKTEAGVPLRFNLIAKSCSGEYQKNGGDVFKAVARQVGSEEVPYNVIPRFEGDFTDFGNGTYEGAVNVTRSGHYEVDVYHLIRGGLKGTYYTDSFLSESRLDLVRIDDTVNFTWGSDPISTFGRDFVSVRWEGYIVPAITSTYNIWLDVDDHVRLWIDGVLIIDWWTFSPTSSMLHVETDLTAFKAHELVLEYRDITGDARARLLWSTESTPISTIPSYCLMYREPTGSFNFTVYPAQVAKESVAEGEGIFAGFAGSKLSFIIQPNDRFGNFHGWPSHSVFRDSVYLDKFHATAELLGGDSGYIFPVKIVSDESRRFQKASYSPIYAGLYQLNVTVTTGGSSSNHIFGSPFFVGVQPGKTFAPQSVAQGGYGQCSSLITSPCPGMYNGMAGKLSTFSLHAFDKHKNPRNTGGDDWSVSVSGASDDFHYGIIEDHHNGTYSISVLPKRSGSNELHVRLHGSPIRGSPFHMNVAHNQPVGSTSYVLSNHPTNMTAIQENFLIVQAADEWGNDAVIVGSFDDEVNIVIISQNIDADMWAVTSIGGGKYEIMIVPLKAGKVNIAIHLNGSHIRGSPFDVTVLPGVVSSESSTAEGSGLRRATAGVESTFVIQTKDERGNEGISDSTLFDVFLTLQERQIDPEGLIHSDAYDESTLEQDVTVLGALVFIDDGKYMARYSCNISGTYNLYVRNHGKGDIAGSPFRVIVSPAEMSPLDSIVTGSGTEFAVAGEIAPLRVYARDRFQNFCHSAIEIIEVNLVRKDSTNDPKNIPKRLMARDSGRGIFILDYKLSTSGQYELNVTTYTPGGIVGSYFTSNDFSADYLHSMSLDEGIEKYWGECDDDLECDMFGLSGTSYVSALWNGRLSADHDEEYVIAVQCNYGGISSMAIDGKYIPWQACSPSMTTRVSMKANATVDFSLRFKHDEGDTPFVVLKWSSPSAGPLVKIPKSNLFHKLGVGESVFNPNILPSNVYPPMSVANGDLTRAIAGTRQENVIESRDMWGNPLFVGGAKVVAFGHHGPEKLESTVSDNDNGSYTVAFTPSVSGIYWLRVTIHGSDIKGSPFLVTVIPGEMDPTASLILFEGGIVGVSSQNLMLDFQAMDSFGNKREEGGDDITAFLTPISKHLLYREYGCSVNYKDGGIYSLNCPFGNEAGDYALHVKARDSDGNMVHTKSSPHSVTIFPSDPHPETTEVTSGGVHVTFPSGRRSFNFTSSARFFGSFVVTAKDLFSNNVLVGGSHFVARIRGDTNEATDDILVMVADQDNGQYMFAYKVSYPSMYNIDVGMVTKSGLLGEYYMSSSAFKTGSPDECVLDQQINFSRRSPHDFYTHIRWTGFVSFPHNGQFRLEVVGVEGHFKLWVDNKVIVHSTGEVNSWGAFNALESHLYDIKIEYSLDVARLLVRLSWSSTLLTNQVIPTSHLFNSIKPINGSPFYLTVTP